MSSGLDASADSISETASPVFPRRDVAIDERIVGCWHPGFEGERPEERLLRLFPPRLGCADLPQKHMPPPVLWGAPDDLVGQVGRRPEPPELQLGLDELVADRQVTGGELLGEFEMLEGTDEFALLLENSTEHEVDLGIAGAPVDLAAEDLCGLVHPSLGEVGLGEERFDRWVIRALRQHGLECLGGGPGVAGFQVDLGEHQGCFEVLRVVFGRGRQGLPGGHGDPHRG